MREAAVAFVFHPLYRRRLPADRRLPAGKAGLLHDLARAAGLLEGAPVLAPAPAPRPWLELAHHPAWVARALSGRLEARERRLLGFAPTPDWLLRVRLGVGGTVLAARLALDHGLAFHFAGGGHHAGPDGPGPFCLFNDVAVAVRVLRAEGRVRRVLVLDLDVHQGDGTARIMARDADIATVSLHAARNHPVRKARSRLDLALDDGLDGTAYLTLLHRLLPPLLDRLRPELALVVAGVDVHRDDPLGRLALDDAALAARERLVLGMLRARGIPSAWVPGGGYGPPEVAARRHLVSLGALCAAAAASQVAS